MPLIGLALLLILPALKFLSYKIGSFSLSADKIYFLYCVLMFTLFLYYLRLSKTFLNTDFAYFSFFSLYIALVQLVYMIMGGTAFDLFGIFGSAYHFILYPALICFLCSSANTRVFKAIDFAKKLTTFLCFLAIPQLLLSIFGLPISYESIGEQALENRAVIWGMEFLRPNSFFGEPRDLASVCLTIMFLKLLNPSSTSKIQAGILLVISFITVSSTAVLCLLGCLIIYCLLSLNPRRLGNAVLGFLTAAFLIYIFADFFDYFGESLGRFNVIQDALSSDTLEGLGPSLLAQASDMLVIPYIFTLEFWSLSGFFGFGIGSESKALQSLLGIFSVSEISTDIVMGSRLLWFTLLIEFGILGFMLCVIFFLSKIWFVSDQMEGRVRIGYRINLLCALWCSAQSTTFIIYLVLAELSVNFYRLRTLNRSIF